MARVGAQRHRGVRGGRMNSAHGPKELHKSNYKSECVQVCRWAGIERDVDFGR